jgi:bifunctional DNA-binding transcriptional regulator/antitoxin component of YhaV-PrlF toxin-antitoxin module
MNSSILSLSDRGQITIPQEMRKMFSVKHFICKSDGENIILQPLQTKDEFMNELEDAEKDWEKNGGLNLSQIKKKYNL